MKFPFRKKAQPPPPPKKPERYHGYLHSTWGHACYVQPPNPAGQREAVIFGTAPYEGDIVLLRSQKIHPETGEHGVLQYRVEGPIRTPVDPGDQHFCTLRFLEAETNEADGRDPR